MADNNRIDDNEGTIDKLTDMWEATGEWFRRRPIAIIMTMVGALIFSGLMGYILVNQSNNRTDIEQVQSAFCNGSATHQSYAQVTNCRHLLDQLLKNPTPEQAARLRQIVKESP